MSTQTTRAHRTRKPGKTKPRSARSDGVETYNHILQVAGKLYAEKGFVRTTSREICVAAGTDMGAVNYHFGNKDGLYQAALIEAHTQIVELDVLEAIAQSSDSPECRLRTLITLLVRGSSRKTVPWGLRVLMHELTAPSAHVSVLMRKAILPKVRHVMSIIAAVLGLPVEHPAVKRALAFVVMPCIMMDIAPREVVRQIIPGLTSDPQALADEMASYALAGLQAIKQKHRTTKVRQSA